MTFPVNDGTIVKKIRLRPKTLDLNIQIVRKYKFSYEKYPPDVLFWTEWSDLGWGYEKVARFLILNIDTGGVDCSVQVQADGQTVKTVTVNTTVNDRERIIPMVSDMTNPTLLVGRLWRLVFTPGFSGKAQVFSAGLDYVPDAAAITFYDTWETSFGVPTWKFIKQIFLTYWSSGPLKVKIFRENAIQFYEIILPTHPNRDSERFYLPAVSDGVLNKSRNYRIQLSTNCPNGPGL